MSQFSTPPTYEVDGQLVILDSDLAEVFGYTTGRLNEVVKRNAARFTDDFTLLLEGEALGPLISQNAISKPKGRGGRRKGVRVYTEHGVVMVATLLKSDKAIAASQFIVRVFVAARRAQGQVDRANAQVPVAMDQVAASDPSGLRGKIQGVIDKILDQIADPVAGSTVREEAQEVLSEGITSLKALVRNPQVKEQQALADISVKIREAEKLVAETRSLDIQNREAELALFAKQLRFVVATEEYMLSQNRSALLQVLEDLG